MGRTPAKCSRRSTQRGERPVGLAHAGRRSGEQVPERRIAAQIAPMDHRVHEEAHDILAPVYNWFTEGFDTLDLKDAKMLLDELA